MKKPIFYICIFLITQVLFLTPAPAKSVVYEQPPLAFTVFNSELIFSGTVATSRLTARTEWDSFQVHKVAVAQVFKGYTQAKVLLVPSANNMLEIAQDYIFMLSKAMLDGPKKYRNMARLQRSFLDLTPQNLSRVKQLLGFKSLFDRRSGSLEGLASLCACENDDIKLLAMYYISHNYPASNKEGALMAILPLVSQKTSSVDIKRSALRSIAFILRWGEPAAECKAKLVRSLKEALESADPDLTADSWEVLNLLDQQAAFEILFSRLRNAETLEKKDGVLSLVLSAAYISDDRIWKSLILSNINFLKKFLGQGNPDSIREKTAELIFLLHSRDQFDLWVSLLKDRDYKIREKAVSILSGYGCTEPGLADASMLPVFIKMKGTEPELCVRKMLEEVVRNNHKYFRRQ